MKHIKLWLATMAVLLSSIPASAATTYPDWTSTNKGQAGSTSSKNYTITANAGDVLTFDWLVSSESGYDKFIVTLSGSEILNKSGEYSGAYEYSFTQSGTYTLLVKYTKDGSVDRGNDYAKVYNVILVANDGGSSTGGDDSVIASGVCGDNLTWELTGAGKLVIEGTGTMTDNPWYQYNSSIKNVVIQEGVTSIVAAAFDGCLNLVGIIIPNTIEQIDYYAFYGCTNLANVILPNSVTYIGSSAFQDCTGLVNVTIPNGSIASYMFNGCTNLANVTIGGGVTNIEWGIFKGCTSLKELRIEDGTETLNITPQGIKFLEDAPLETLYLGRNINYSPSSTSAGSSPFSDLSTLKSITIGSSVTSIEEETFRNCSNLTSITCKAVTPPTCGSYTFYNVSAAIPVNVPSTSISAYKTANYWSEFTNIIGIRVLLDSGVCGDNLTWTLYSDGELIIEGTGMMNDYSLPSSSSSPSPWYNNRYSISKVTLQNGVTSIGDYAFRYCVSLTSIIIPESVTSIGDYAFNNCDGLVGITIPESVTSIGVYAFGNCDNLTSITMLGGVTSIRDYTFSRCNSLTFITIPESVTSIGYSSFEYCKNLTSITIPKSVTEIEDNAFSSCSSLTCITSEVVAPPTIGYYAFSGVDKSIPLYVPRLSISAYQSVNYWSEFTNIQAMPETITINQYGSATFCSEYALDFSEVDGLKAYAATGYKTSTGVVTLTRVMTSQPGMGLFLKGEPGEYVVPTLESTDENSLNMLVGLLESTKLNGMSADAQYYNYRYTIHEGDGEPMFYRIDEGYEHGAGKAYLQIPVAWMPAEAKSISLRFDDEDGTTDIEEMDPANQDAKIIYDLMGRKVSNPQEGGVYIVNGNKIVW